MKRAPSDRRRAQSASARSCGSRPRCGRHGLRRSAWRSTGRARNSGRSPDAAGRCRSARRSSRSASGRMPGPSSSTTISTSFFSRRQVTRTVPPGGENERALSIRLSTTWPSRESWPGTTKAAGAAAFEVERDLDAVVARHLVGDADHRGEQLDRDRPGSPPGAAIRRRGGWRRKCRRSAGRAASRRAGSPRAAARGSPRSWRAAASRPPSAARSAGSSARARRRRRSSRSPRCGCRAHWSCRAARRTDGRSRRARWVKSGISTRDGCGGAPFGAVGEPAHRAGDGAGEQHREHHHDAGRDQEHAHDRSRSASTIWSMSPPCVDSSSAPRTARKRCTGTATETMTSPRSLTRTMLAFWPASALRDFRIVLAVCRAELAIERQVAARRASVATRSSALDEVRLLGIRRRQVEAQHVAADRDCGCRASARRRGRRCARACWSARSAGAAPARRAPD